MGSPKLQTKDLRNYGRAEIPILVLVLVSSILLFFSHSELQTPIRGLLKAMDTDNNSLGAGIIVDEDFRNGSFNSTTADYWTINGKGTGFRPPNNRDFGFGLSNQIALGGGSFSNNFGYSIPDAESSHPSQLQQFGINKVDEVAVVRYQTFSDVAKNSREQYHVQVALLQTDPNLEGFPNFGHDLSLETESRFVSLNAANSDRLQLTANADNIENVTSAQKNAYFDNTMTAGDLDPEYTNLVIWRNEPGVGTNIEQWSNNSLGDYDIANELVNQFPQNQNPDYALFNEIRVFLQRGGTNVDLIRDGVDINDAQIGINQLHVGITKRTDFNLDYRTDAADFILWNTYRNRDGIQTILTGDADNNSSIDLNDFELWQDNRGLIHDSNATQSQSVYTYDTETAISDYYLIPSAEGKEPIFVYNRLTGELLLDTQGESLTAWIVRGQLASSVESLGENWWTADVGNTQQWVDLSLEGFISNELTPIASFTPGLEISDFGLIEVGYADGGGKLVSVTEATLESLDLGLVTHLKFDETSGVIASDSSSFGQNNSATLLNGATFDSVSGDFGNVVTLDGNDDYLQIDNSSDLNLGIHSQRTIAFWFKSDDETSAQKQVLYEEGGTTRGLNIYIDNNQLYVGGCNRQESNWLGTYLSTKRIASNSWHHVALVLDGKETVRSDSLTGYLDGEEFGRGEGSQLWQHGDRIGLGAVNQRSRFHDGVSQDTHTLKGSLEDIRIYNRILAIEEINILSSSSIPPSNETALFSKDFNNLEALETESMIDV